MNQELSNTLATEINKLYSEAHELAFKTQSFACKAIETAIKCGNLLIEAQEVVGKGNFEQWLRDNCREISRRTAYRYIKLARVLPVSQCGTGFVNNFDHPTLRQAYIAAGILPDPVAITYKDNEPKGTSPKYLTYIANAQGAFNVEFSKRPLETWDELEREQVKAQLKPIVRIYEML